ncbi:MAG: hypothetical protein JWR62_100, partial [Modestobacter sp.]|nr:hypothetical protein [Modestobacter sp.]
MRRGLRTARLAAFSAAIAVCLVAGPGTAAADPGPPTEPAATDA